jgi:AcrR family transcriptional regulator
MDRRVRKTQAAVYSAFVALIIERGYDAISVQDIIDEADVGRTTFYAHFRSKKELLVYGFERLREELMAIGSGQVSERWGFVGPLLEHARAHLGLYRALLAGNGGHLAETSFHAIAEDLVAKELDGDGVGTALLAGAIVGAVRAWIARPVGMEMAEVVARFRVLAGAIQADPDGA